MHAHTHARTYAEIKFYTQLTRKHVSNAFFNSEMESELGERNLKEQTFFKSDKDMNEVMTRIGSDRVAKPYSHVQSSSCGEKGKNQCH